MARQIYRAEALQRYNDRLEKTVLPRPVSTPWLLLFWTCCGLLLLCTALLWSARFPVYTDAVGVVVAPSAGMNHAHELVVAAFLPAESAQHVAVNQRAILHLLGSAEDSRPAGPEDPPGTVDKVTGIVAALEPEALSPAMARTRYGLDGSTGLLVKERVVVATIPLEAPATDLLGSVGDVQIEIGTESGLALIPGIGRLFAHNNPVSEPDEPR